MSLILFKEIWIDQRQAAILWVSMKNIPQEIACILLGCGYASPIA